MLEGEDFLVIDNFIPKGFCEALHLELYRKEYWAYSSRTVDYEKKDWLDSPMLTHTIFNSEEGPVSPLFNEVRTISCFLEDRTGFSFDAIVRVKANLTYPQPHKTLPNPPHVDETHDDCFSMVLYLNDSDGDTVLYDKRIEDGDENLKEIVRVEPISGKAVIFNSNRFHSSSPPKNNSHRIIINSVFTAKMMNY